MSVRKKGRNSLDASIRQTSATSLTWIGLADTLGLTTSEIDTMAKKRASKKKPAAKRQAASAKTKPGKSAFAGTKTATTNLIDALRQLKSLGNEKVRGQNAKSSVFGQGAGDNQFGVPLGDIRTLAKKIKTNHALALELWNTGNVDAQFLATLLIEPKKLSAKEMDRLVRSIAYVRVADWLLSYIVASFPDKETLRQSWMDDDDRWAARAGWQLTASRVAKSPDGLDLPALLTRIEKEMGDAEPEVQWTMNNTLAAIGIHCPQHRQRAIAIGEKLGIYQDYPVSKGCTSPFAPIWIDAMASRKG